MALGAEWIGVIGAVAGTGIGAIATLGSQWLTGRAQVQARTEDRQREDQLRYIDDRRALYQAWIAAAQQALSAGDTDDAEAAVPKVVAATTSITLLAAIDVQEKCGDFYEALFNAIKEPGFGRIPVRERRNLTDAFQDAVEAMRTDLQIPPTPNQASPED